MSIFKRGRVYWFHFIFSGEHIQRSTKQGNPRVARQIEAAHKTALAKGEAGIGDKAPVSTLKTFAPTFMEAINARCSQKPGTIRFYSGRLDRLLEYEPLASSRLNQIDEQLIERYIQARRKGVSIICVNRELATLRRLIRLAQQWKLIDRIPRIALLPGEHMREFVLSSQQEKLYLSKVAQPLHDPAVLMLDTGLRIGEAISLQWSDIRLEEIRGAKFGLLQVRNGKSKNAKRYVPLTSRVREMLASRLSSRSEWVFPGNSSDSPILGTSLDHLHSKVRKALSLPSDFVLHSLRHTMLTRLGEAGVEAFTIMRIAGHSSVTISQRYVHPTPEAVERAFTRLELHNQLAEQASFNCPKALPPATLSATVSEPSFVTH
jgi:integrase